jgi:F0F1-type ATP synthase assembly protein I
MTEQPGGPPQSRSEGTNGANRTNRTTGADRSAVAMFGALTGIATTSAVLVVGGAALGYLVDGWTGAPHVFVFLGIALGIALAVLSARSIVRRFFR